MKDLVIKEVVESTSGYKHTFEYTKRANEFHITWTSYMDLEFVLGFNQHSDVEGSEFVEAVLTDLNTTPAASTTMAYSEEYPSIDESTVLLKAVLKHLTRHY